MRRIMMGVAVVVAMSGCAAIDDGFRDKLAEGCKTERACAALASEADTRYRACMDSSTTGRDCNDQLKDKWSASGLAADRSDQAKAARRDRQQKEQADNQAAADTMRADFHSIGDSCDDIAALEAKAQSLYASKDRADMAAEYRKQAASRRKTRLDYFSYQLRDVMARKPRLPTMDDPEAARQDVTQARAMVDGMRCYDASAADRQDAVVSPWANAREAAVKAELQCRATPSCMGDRMLPEICQLISDRADAVADMAAERRNPSGYVDARLLHDLGEQVQHDDAEIARYTRLYLGVSRSAFNARSCPKDAQ